MFHHVTNGDSARFSMEESGIPGPVSVWCDPLYDGPVPPGDDEQVMQARARVLDRDDYAATLDELRGWRRAIADSPYDEIVLWFEHDLFDQLNLIQLLSWLPQAVPPDRTVSLICIGSFPGRPHFKGLGELTPPELASLLPTRKPVTAAQYALAERAWTAFRSPDPEALDRLRLEDASPLPFLGPSLERFLEDYPWVSDGLSRTERELLQLADAGPLDLRAAFPLMSKGARWYHVTDTALADVAESLASSSPPLATLSDSTAAESHPRHRTLTITDLGRSVLSRRRDRIEACGLDRWFGGVHVRSTGDIWRWDDDRRRIVRS